MSDHAKLSPSAAKRWLTCPGSVALTADMPDSSSEYARIGTLCHDLAERCLVQELDAGEVPLTGELADLEEQHIRYVQEYVDYVRAIPGTKFIEVRMRMNDDVWGTSDAVIFSGTKLVVVDLKTGSGVKVSAEENEQMRIYALMALQEYDWLFGPFDEVEMHIVQPPLDHISVWSQPVQDLLSWSKDVLEPGIRMALQPDAPLAVSPEGCRFCKARAQCAERARVNMHVAMEEFGAPCPNPNLLTLEQIASLLPRMDQIAKWTGEVQEYALSQALAGHELPGYKVVEGRTSRKWSDEAAVADAMRAEGLSNEQIYTMKIVGMTEAAKLLGAKSGVFDLAQKVPGKPVLVPITDKRAPLSVSSAARDFAEET